MKRHHYIVCILATAAFFMLCVERPLFAVEKQSWASRPIAGQLWGMAWADLGGDGEKQMLLLERHALRVAKIDGEAVTTSASFSWGSTVDGVRLFAMDVDGDGDEEAVVSAIQNGWPSSMILDWKGDRFEPVVTGTPWHLRAVTHEGGAALSKPILIGQHSTTSRFYFGRLYELSVEKGKIEKVRKLDLPSWAYLYRYAPFPSTSDGAERIALLKEYAPLELLAKEGRKFRRSWRSGERFGGSLNLVKARVQEPLGIVVTDMVGVGHEPVAFWGKQPLLVAPQHDILLRGIIGRKPYVTGARIKGFATEEVLGMVEVFDSADLPGYIADFLVTSPEGKPELLVLLQLTDGFFDDVRASRLLRFDLPGESALTNK